MGKSGLLGHLVALQDLLKPATRRLWVLGSLAPLGFSTVLRFFWVTSSVWLRVPLRVPESCNSLGFRDSSFEVTQGLGFAAGGFKTIRVYML